MQGDTQMPAIAHRPDFSQTPVSAKLPTLVVHGGGDVAIAPKDARAMAKRLGAQFAQAAEAGHCLPMEEPDWFGKTLGAFLRKHKLPS